MEEVKKGLLIVVEGVDNVGKTTLINSLVRDNVPLIKFSTVAMPVLSSDDITKDIKRVMMGHDNLDGHTRLMLNAASIRHTVECYVKPLLEMGTSVILDRYAYSTMAYQSLEGVSVDLIFDTLFNDMKIPIPDVIIYLDTDRPLNVSRDEGVKDPYDHMAIEQRNKLRDRYGEVLLSATMSGVAVHRYYPALWSDQEELFKTVADLLNGMH